MPAFNPFIDPGINVEATDGSPVNFTAGLPTLQQAVRPASAQAGIGGRFEGWIMNAAGNSASTVNAAGTSENVALHVAAVIAFALVGVYLLRQSGFKFAVAGSVGR